MIGSHARSFIVNTTNLSGNFPESSVGIGKKAIGDTFSTFDDSIRAIGILVY